MIGGLRAKIGSEVPDLLAIAVSVGVWEGADSSAAERERDRAAKPCPTSASTMKELGRLVKRL
jgi:hypothetical protein